jgi:YggT family protein
MSSIQDLLCLAIVLYIIAMFGRFILSWFPIASDSPVAVVARVLFRITEPVLGPVRRLLPPVRLGGGALDLSPLIVLFTLQYIVRGVLLGCG